MLVYISLALLAISCVLLAWVARELGKQLRVLTADMRMAEALLKCAHENDVEFDQRITELKRSFAAAEDLIKEHAELEREAANSEKLFQEGLANILSYGVVKNE
jgi:hypothetical protein